MNSLNKKVQDEDSATKATILRDKGVGDLTERPIEDSQLKPEDNEMKQQILTLVLNS